MLTLTLGEPVAQFADSAGAADLGPVATKDGYIVPAVASEKTFQSLAAACGHPEWISDRRFAEYNDRRANWGELFDELEKWSKERTTADVQAMFDRHGVPSSPYRTVKEAMADPQLAHRHALSEIHDAGGTFRALNPPFRMSAATTAVAPHAAALGEHTEALLRELGYGPAEIAALNG
jgi:crotonobetainyl-CoA:carnitine CoA-transferase CaiB-like acyl-CoA transferase